MTTLSRRLRAHRDAMDASAKSGAGESPAPDEPEDPNLPDDEEDEVDAKGKKKGKTMDTISKAEHEIAVSKAATDAAAATNARWADVLACEDYAGRETLARTLLGTEMSAADIKTALAAAPKPATAAAPDADALEAAARSEVQDALKSGAQNSTVDAGSQGKPTDPAAIDALWSKAIARVSPASIK